MAIRHVSAINAHYAYDGSYQLIYPPEPTYSDRCVTNLDYDTLPKNYPMRTTILGPTTLKHLYRGPQYYPQQVMKVPKGTLYDYDNSSYDVNGKRRTYGSSIYPFHQRSPREVIDYSANLLPLPAVEQWTKYPVLTDGAWGR